MEVNSVMSNTYVPREITAFESHKCYSICQQLFFITFHNIVGGKNIAFGNGPS